MKETAVEVHLMARAEDLGGRAIKLLPWVMRGLPDRLVLLPGGRVWFVETKAPGKVLKSHQVRWKEWLVAMEFNWAMLDTREKVDEWYVERCTNT